MEYEKKIYVYFDFNTCQELIGILYTSNYRGKELFSFEYDSNWLSKYKFNIDPELSLYSGRQYVDSNKAIFGVFSDSCPDRWGRTLLNRKESLEAKKENRRPKQLQESDYLLGVYDVTRMGAIRFSLELGGKFQSTDFSLSVPPWISLRTLENASLALENLESLDEEKWLQQLLAPGSSLGGARPKANVISPDGSLWIAKFPSKNDDYDVGLWEKITHDLAELCGLNVPEAKLETFSKYGSTYLTKRFDREKERRIPMTSAMTLLGSMDGDSEMKSYLDMVQFIKSNGSNPEEDLKELWKRIVFNVLVSNTDDHLRNHSFLMKKNGWELAPLYDVNPNFYGNHLSLNINEQDNSMDLDLILSTAKHYGLEKTMASQIIEEMKKTIVLNLPGMLKKYKISRDLYEKMKPAFSLSFS